MRAAFYGGLAGYAISVLNAAYPHPLLYSILPSVTCVLGAQMVGALWIDGPINALLYAAGFAILAKVCGLAIRKPSRELGHPEKILSPNSK